MIKANGFIILDYCNKLYYNNINNNNTNKEYYDINYSWCEELRMNYNIINDEYLEYIKNHKLASHKDIHESQTNIDISSIPWPIIYLRVYNKNTNNIKYLPKTYDLLNKIPNCISAMISILPPGKKIPIHSGSYKGVLRYHLGLKIPKDRDNCFIMVNNKKYSWKEGEDVLFDDTLEHYVENNTNETRVILLLDIKRNFNNILLNSINSFITTFGQFNNTVTDIVNNVNIIS